jgi:hypothetical protein
MAERIKLHPGGRLVLTPWEQESENPEEYVTEDVSERASLYLMEPIELDSSTRLLDLIILLRKDATLQHIFSRDLAKEYLAAAFTLEAVSPTGARADDALEYLVLYSQWYRDTETGVLEGVDCLEFSGMGFVLQEDRFDYGNLTGKAGTRIKYALDLRPLKELLALPLRYNSVIEIREGRVESEDYYTLLDTVTVERPTLGQVLHAVLTELTFHGLPSDSQEMANQVRELAAEAKDSLN